MFVELLKNFWKSGSKKDLDKITAATTIVFPVHLPVEEREEAMREDTKRMRALTKELNDAVLGYQWSVARPLIKETLAKTEDMRH
jgi:hypothetical protein